MPMKELIIQRVRSDQVDYPLPGPNGASRPTSKIFYLVTQDQGGIAFEPQNGAPYDTNEPLVIPITDRARLVILNLDLNFDWQFRYPDPIKFLQRVTLYRNLAIEYDDSAEAIAKYGPNGRAIQLKFEADHLDFQWPNTKNKYNTFNLYMTTYPATTAGVRTQSVIRLPFDPDIKNPGDDPKFLRRPSHPDGTRKTGKKGKSGK